MRPAEVADVDFVGARSERIRLQAVKRQRLDFVLARRFARQSQATMCEASTSMRRFDSNSLRDDAQGATKGSFIRGNKLQSNTTALLGDEMTRIVNAQVIRDDVPMRNLLDFRRVFPR